MPYNLEKVASPRWRIYQQAYQYYHFCEYVRQMTPATLTSKTYAINDFIRQAQLTDSTKITNQMIFAWIAAQTARGNSGRSINDRLAHLKAMLRWQQEVNLPMPKLKLALVDKAKEAPARKVCFTRAEVARVLAQANQIEWLLVRISFDCGLRINELRLLSLSNLHGSRLTICGKGQKRRYAFLCPETKHKLDHWIQQQGIKDYLWPSPLLAGQPLATCTLRKYMSDAFSRAGYGDFCPHDLRHSYATDLKQLGASTRQIQAGLGHSSEAVTERYLSDLDGFDLRELYALKYMHLRTTSNMCKTSKNH